MLRTKHARVARVALALAAVLPALAEPTAGSTRGGFDADDENCDQIATARGDVLGATRTGRRLTEAKLVGESCSSDSDCYDQNSNWCHADTGLCAAKSDWGGRCTTDDHCKHDNACLDDYCCDFDRDGLEWRLPYCTACAPRNQVTEWFASPDNKCAACEDGAWLDTSEPQSDIDRVAQHDSSFAGVVADFGRCRKTCSETEYQDGSGCTAKKAPGEACAVDERCASGLCGGSYCCDANAVAISCTKPCDQGTGVCSTFAQVGESCSSDSDCYDPSSNWCHADTGLCAAKSDWGGRCTTDDHCKHDKACLGDYCCEYRRDSLSWSHPYCTACVPRNEATERYRGSEGECADCEAGAWLDTSGPQSDMDRDSEHDSRWFGVVADFGRCRKTCSETEYQHGSGCTAKKAPGEACAVDERCASGLCGGSYCCDTNAATRSAEAQCCTLCDPNGECVRREECADAESPAPAPETSSSGDSSDPPAEAPSPGESAVPPSKAPSPGESSDDSSLNGGAATHHPSGRKRAKARATRDAMLAGIRDDAARRKATFLTDALMDGRSVRSMRAEGIPAADADAACARFFAETEIDDTLGVCVATNTSTASAQLQPGGQQPAGGGTPGGTPPNPNGNPQNGRRRGRALTATTSTFSVSAYFDADDVDVASMDAAAEALRGIDGVSGVAVEEDVDAVEELRTIEGVEANTLETFAAEAEEAAAEAEAETGAEADAEAESEAEESDAAVGASSTSPPPPPLSPPRLVVDDEDGADGRGGGLVVAVAAACAAMSLGSGGGHR